MIKARALGNERFVLEPNPVGNLYNGHSSAVDPLGRMQVDLEEKEGLEVIELDSQLVTEVRDKFPLLKNRRTDVYNKYRRSVN